MGTILLSSNTSWYIYNFRRNLIASLRNRGHEVIVAAPEDTYSSRLAGIGATFAPLPMDNKGRNPLTDGFLFARFLTLLAKARPICYLGFTIKPNIYGSFAAGLLRIPTVNNVSGLGSVFASRSLTQSLVRMMYSVALRKSHRIFFQNKEDLLLFVDHGLAQVETCEVLPGSGVDTEYFTPRTRQGGDGAFTFLYIGRLLREKGILDFVEAARSLRSHPLKPRFQILGFVGVDNPTAIQRPELERWIDEGAVQFLGETDDVRPHIANAHCIVLPSYYGEGVPRSLLEAASMERPAIATDMPGCRDAVVDTQTGFLSKPRDCADLIAKMKMVIDLPEQSRELMGKAARKYVQEKFAEEFVIARYLSVIGELAQANRL